MTKVGRRRTVVDVARAFDSRRIRPTRRAASAKLCALDAQSGLDPVASHLRSARTLVLPPATMSVLVNNGTTQRVVTACNQLACKQASFCDCKQRKSTKKRYTKKCYKKPSCECAPAPPLCCECAPKKRCDDVVIKCRCVNRCRKLRVSAYARQCCPCDKSRWLRYEADVIQPYRSFECEAYSVKKDKYDDDDDDYCECKAKPKCGCKY